MMLMWKDPREFPYNSIMELVGGYPDLDLIYCPRPSVLTQ